MARRKKDPETGLTKQQYHFCREFVKTGSGSDAYRAAYSCKNMKASSIYRCTAELMANPIIASNIASMQAETDTAASKELGLSREWILSRLMKNARIALGEEKVTVFRKNKATGEMAEMNVAVLDQTAANQSLSLLGKVDVIGMFVEKSKIELSKTFEEQTDEELDAFIAANASNATSGE